MARGKWVLALLMLTVVLSIIPSGESSTQRGSSVSLVYERTGTNSDQNFFYQGQVAELEFNVSGSGQVEFYLTYYAGANWHEEISTVDHAGLVNVSVNTSLLQPGLYQVYAQSGNQTWDGVSQLPVHDFQEEPWLVAVMKPLSLGEISQGLPNLTVPFGLGVNAYLPSPGPVQRNYLSMIAAAGFKMIRTDLYVQGTDGNWQAAFPPMLQMAEAEEAVGIRKPK